MKKTEEQKAVEVLVEALDNHWFNPAIFANLIVNEQPLYTQDKLVELISYIIKYQSARFKDEAEHDITSEGLILANVLAEVIEENESFMQGPNRYISKYYSLDDPQIDPHTTRCVDFFVSKSVGMWAKISIYDELKNSPKV